MRVLIVDDNFGYRRLLRRVLEAEPDIALVFEASDGEEGLRLAQQFKPDVVLMDIDMPGTDTDGLEATRSIKESLPGATVVILSARDGEAYRQRAAECGADAYLPKTASIFEILTAIRDSRSPKVA
jgi:DNA-binding NarL/FixJ family response regulator